MRKVDNRENKMVVEKIMVTRLRSKMISLGFSPPSIFRCVSISINSKFTDLQIDFIDIQTDT